MHNCHDLVRIFHQCFYHDYRTRLVSGAEEPLYVPANQEKQACIYFTQDYFSSALHELSHWCIAGPERRQLEDYGYWYYPDGRSEEQQRQFEQVEVKPQALEWIFSTCCNLGFRISVDNLTGTVEASTEFEKAVCTQAQQWLKQGLTGRALTFAQALSDHYRKGCLPSWKELKLEVVS